MAGKTTLCVEDVLLLKGSPIKWVGVVLFLCLGLESFGVRWNYPTTETSNLTGTNNYCVGAAATAITFSFTNALCGSGGPNNVSITVNWYEDTDATPGGGILVNTTGSTASTTSHLYTPPTTVAGSKYYYCVVSWTAIDCVIAGSLTSTASRLVIVTDIPNTQASSFSASSITSSSMTVSWARGNGSSVLVVARAGSAVNADPVSGTGYASHPNFGSGSQIGTGNFVVYNGSGTSVNVTGLTASTFYHYAIYEFNSGSNCYMVTELTGNAQTGQGFFIYLTTSGGSLTTEKWVNITTGVDGSGTQVWGQGNGTIGNGAGLVTDIAINVADYCGITLYLNSYDEWEDSWDGTLYTLEETVSGPTIINNGGASPDDGSAMGAGGWQGTVSEIEISEAFVIPCPCLPQPTVVPSSFSSSAITSSAMTINWVRGDGDAVIVLASKGAAVDTDPVSYFTYSANSIFGSGDEVGSGNFVVYDGTGTSVALSGLDDNSTYYFAIYEYESGSPCYLETELTGNATTSTCTSPSTQASGFSASSVGGSSMSLNWTRGNGDGGVVILAKAYSPVNTDPTSGIIYTANSVFGSGDELGDGNFVVYHGSGTSTSITGLSTSTNYYFAIYEYNLTDVCFNKTELIGSEQTLECVYAMGGMDKYSCSGTATMAASNPSVGVGTWTLISGSGSITDPNSPTTTVTGLGSAPSTAVLRWTVTSGDCSLYDEVNVYSMATTGDPGDLDFCSFNTNDIGVFAGLDGEVVTIEIQNDGKIIIGGNFTKYSGYTRNRIARLNSDGSIDTSFDPSGGANGSIETVAIQSDGKILIGGYFGSYDGTSRSRIARINSDGSIDVSFNPGSGANSYVTSIAIQDDGKILVGGDFTTINGQSANGIARLNADGSYDSFTQGGGFSGGNYRAWSVNLQDDGKVIIGGDFTAYNGTGRNNIARLNSDGSIDTSFDPGTGTDGSVLTSVIQNDGKILLGGTSFTNYNGVGRTRIVRVNTDGSLDTSFDPGTGANNGVSELKIQGDGKILAGGNFTDYNGNSRNRIVRINSDGSIDNSFNPGLGATSTVSAIRIQDNGTILIGGYFFWYDQIKSKHFVRLNADGSFINRSIAADHYIYGRAIQDDDKILVGGEFKSYFDTPINRIVRLNADGSIDGTFNPGTGADSTVYKIVIQGDGKIIIVGYFTSFDGVSRNRIARLNSDGSLDTSFDPGLGADNIVFGVTLLTGGKILIGGAFNSYNGSSRKYIAKLNSDGSLDNTFNTTNDANEYVHDIKALGDGDLLICGNFTAYAGTSMNYIARINSDGSHDTGFNPGTGANDAVSRIVIQPDNKLLLCGYFTSFNGTGRNRIARINSDGTLDGTFNSSTGANDRIYSMGLQTDGKILIGGIFTSYDGTGRNRIARVNSNGSIDTSFDPGSGANLAVFSVLIDSESTAMVDGAFTTYNGISRRHICRVFNESLSSYYWIGGAGDWSNTAKWSSSSGGASCSCVPSGSDIVVFDSNSISTHHTEINVPSGTWQVKSIQFTEPALQPAIVGEGVLIINP